MEIAMPKITHLKEFEGALWARLELDLASKDMPVHIVTDSEIKAIKDAERKAVWDEIKYSTRSSDDDGHW
jgi:hypothetical protein